LAPLIETKNGVSKCLDCGKAIKNLLRHVEMGCDKDPNDVVWEWARVARQ